MRIDRGIDQLESRNMRFRTALALMATATVVGVTVERPCLALDAVEAHDSMVRNDTGRINHRFDYLRHRQGRKRNRIN